MKNTAMVLVAATSLILLTVVIFATINFSFGLVFYLTCLGQGLLIFTVYKVLRDDYSTDKTFEDFYEDHPIGKEQD